MYSFQKVPFFQELSTFYKRQKIFLPYMNRTKKHYSLPKKKFYGEKSWNLMQ